MILWKTINETQACLKENSINLTCESSKSIIELLVIYFSMNERFCNFIILCKPSADVEVGGTA